jgi:hypothetical protein
VSERRGKLLEELFRVAHSWRKASSAIRITRAELHENERSVKRVLEDLERAGERPAMADAERKAAGGGE